MTYPWALIIALAFAQLSAYAQIPYPIKIRFMEDFTGASQTKWERPDSTNYRVTFYHQSQEKQVVYSPDCSQLQVLIQLTSIAQVPVSVQRKLDRFHGYVIDQIIEKRTSDHSEYCFSLFNDKKSLELSISPAGKTIYSHWTKRMVDEVNLKGSDPGALLEE